MLCLNDSKVHDETSSLQPNTRIEGRLNHITISLTPISFCKLIKYNGVVIPNKGECRSTIYLHC